MKAFEEGKYFAWGDSIYEAIGQCEVERDSMSGDSIDILRFEEDCSISIRLCVCVALDADTTFLEMDDSDEEFEDE